MTQRLNNDLVGKLLHFETYLGERFSNMRLACFVDALTAVRLGLDAAAKHQQYFGSLPAGTPDDWRSYQYALFYNVEQQTVILGVPWIRESSITENDNPPRIYTVYGATDEQDASIRAMFRGNGITNFEVSRG